MEVGACKYPAVSTCQAPLPSLDLCIDCKRHAEAADVRTFLFPIQQILQQIYGYVQRFTVAATSCYQPHMLGVKERIGVLICILDKIERTPSKRREA